MGFFWDIEKLELTSDYIWSSGYPINRYWISLDGEIIVKPNGDFHFRKGFIWDNATGVGSGKALTPLELSYVPVKSLTKNHVTQLWLATLVHDVICRYSLSDIDFPFDRSTGDLFFLKLAKESGFKHYWLYYRAVRLFTKIVCALNHKKT